MEPLRPGDPQAIGAYRLLGRLGAGGMGLVFLGRSPGGLLVAIKVVHRHLTEDADFRDRFRREVRAARAVSGAFTAPVIDADTEASAPWLVTTFLPGMSLQGAVTAHGPLPVPAVFALGAGLAEALVSIHRAGVVHRDLKPSNVILALDGPRVIDFGVAHAADAGGITQAGTTVGSPGFIAPEQARGEVTGPAADVFALAGVLVFAATGQGPFGQAPPHVLIYRAVHEPPRLAPVTDPALRALVAACLDRDPRRRPDPGWLLGRLSSLVPATADLHGTGWLPEAIATGIAADIARTPGEIPEPTAPNRPDHPGRPVLSRRRVLAAGGAGAAVLAGAAAVLLWPDPDPDPPRRLRPAAGSVSPGPSTPSGPRPVLDGKVVWKRYTGSDYLISSPVVAGGIVCVGSEKGDLLAFDARTGRPRWRHHVGGRITSQPAVRGSVVYVGSESGAVHAVHAGTGRLQWRQEASGTQSNVVLSGGLVYAGGDPVYALDARDGSIRWHRPGDARYGSSRLVAGGVLYVPHGSRLDALDAATGRPGWSYRMKDAAGTPAVADGTVYCGNFQGDELHAFDARTAKRRWAYRATGPVTARPVVAGGTVHVGDWNANLYALDTATGTMRWQVQTDGQIEGNPTLAGGMLYVPSGVYSSGGVYAIEIATGRVVWRFRTDGGISSTPAVAGGLVYASCKDGNLYALDVGGGTATASAPVG